MKTVMNSYSRVSTLERESVNGVTYTFKYTSAGPVADLLIKLFLEALEHRELNPADWWKDIRITLSECSPDTFHLHLDDLRSHRGIGCTFTVHILSDWSCLEVYDCWEWKTNPHTGDRITTNEVEYVFGQYALKPLVLAKLLHDLSYTLKTTSAE